jgi:dTDP-4-dehydrorhamnose reductase
MSKILILGAKGSLGQELVKVFKEGNEVIAWDREEVDITDKDLVLKKVKDVKPDIIINAAAYNAMDKCEGDEKEFELAKKINGEAVGHLAESALEVGALVVHYSTDYVFDGKKKRGYKEDDEARPISKYGETKLAGERALIALSGRRLKWYLIRTSKLFGPKGESEMAKESFFDLISRLSKERKEFNMVHNEEVSCFTYTPDLAKETKNLIESEKGYGIYHITNSGPASWYEAAKYLFELKGITDVKLNAVASSDYPRPAKRPKYSVLLNTKLEPMRSWQEALKEYLSGKL